MTGGGLRVRVLGTTPTIGEEGLQLAPRQADLLTALALSPQGLSPRRLLASLWPNLGHDDTSSVSTTVAYLRQKGVAFRPMTKGGVYCLDYDPDEIDCQRFVTGVQRLPERPEPAAVDDLLALWSGDPWERENSVPHRLWSEVRQELRRLLATVTALGDRALELRHWGAFERMLAGNELLETTRGPVPGPRKPQVLIVDDQIGHEMADVLGNYDTEVIESLPAWNQRKDNGTPLRHVCALVDLHLKREMTDRGGLSVVRDLKERTDMKIVLMSAELPAFQDCTELCKSLGVDKVLPKHNRGEGDFARVGDVVRELAG